MSGPYLEITGYAFKVACKPEVTTTNTEDKWREWAGTGRFVKIDTTQTASRDHGLLPIQLTDTATDTAYGRLESVQGSGDAFTATVLLVGADMHALGSETGALADGDIGQTLKADATSGKEGMLKVESGGFGRVVGGTKANLRIAFNGVENVR